MRRKNWLILRGHKSITSRILPYFPSRKRESINLWILGALCLLTLACAIPIPTTEPLTIISTVDHVQSVDLDGAEQATVRLRLLSKYLTIDPSDAVELLRGHFRYNVKEWAPSVKQTTNGTLRNVTVGQGLGSQIPLSTSDDYVNEWAIALGKGVPIDLDIDIGAGDAALDLSGLSISDLSMTTGSADVSLVFNSPNPEPLGTLRLTSGTGKFAASGLGNANFDRVVVLGGTGTVNLDFGGALQRSAVADITAGAGKIDVRVPAALGVRLTFAGTSVSTVETIGFTEQSENIFVNDAYGVAPLTLTINITAGVGAITLISQ